MELVNKALSDYCIKWKAIAVFHHCGKFVAALHYFVECFNFSDRILFQVCDFTGIQVINITIAVYL